MNNKVFIIAEAGVNHNGDLALAKDMVVAAKQAGADAIKFQTFIPEDGISRFAEKAAYQKDVSGAEETQLQMVKRLALRFEDFQILKDFCEANQIEFLSTAFDFNSIDFLNELGIRMWKVPSGEITDLPYLMKIAKTRKPVLLSTGMSDMQEVEVAVDILKKYGTEELTILHCNTEYPTPYEDVNLKAMKRLENKFSVPVGYSDHTLGIEVSIAAVAMGAAVIEKHFTMDTHMKGPDHKASLDPIELTNMITAIRNVEAAVSGAGDKVPSKSEIKNQIAARKSIVAARIIRKGEPFTEDNLRIKRPGNGISPMRWFDIIGRTANRDFLEDELIEL